MTTKEAPSIAAVPLESGDRLTRAEFERRYACRPDTKKAELVEGVVYVASPVRINHHTRPHGIVTTWIGVFASRTPGVVFGPEGTIRLDNDNEPQPDVLMAWDEAHGGQSRISEDDYLEGAPELVVEVAASSAAYDLHDKMRAYRRNGVREYLVWQMLENRLDWFRLKDGEYLPVLSGDDGIIESEAFPRLLLHVPSLLAQDLAGVLKALDTPDTR